MCSGNPEATVKGVLRNVKDFVGAEPMESTVCSACSNPMDEKEREERALHPQVARKSFAEFNDELASIAAPGLSRYFQSFPVA